MGWTVCLRCTTLYKHRLWTVSKLATEVSGLVSYRYWVMERFVAFLFFLSCTGKYFSLAIDQKSVQNNVQKVTYAGKPTKDNNIIILRKPLALKRIIASFLDRCIVFASSNFAVFVQSHCSHRLCFLQQKLIYTHHLFSTKPLTGKLSNQLVNKVEHLAAREAQRPQQR